MLRCTSELLVGPNENTVHDVHVDLSSSLAWVDSSETATKLNLQYWTHYIGFKALIAALHIAGAGVSLLELLHLRKRDIVNF